MCGNGEREVMVIYICQSATDIRTVSRPRPSLATPLPAEPYHHGVRIQAIALCLHAGDR